ncbi:MAG: hypothetical protein NE327_08660 [Lentisphaeraceae bacterium]|nr:hypothetical protein [Lentisphaeraceae bacterium]
MKLFAKLSLCAVIISLLAGCGKSAPKAEKKLGPAETVTHVSSSIANGDASSAWTSLPKTWRTEINGIAHMIGEKMPTSMWDDSFNLIGRLGKVFEDKNKIFTEMFADKLPPDVAKADVEASIASFGKLLSIIAKSDIAKVESLKTVDLGKVASVSGNEVLNLVMNNKLINKAISDNSKGKAKSLKEAMNSVKAELVSEDGNTAKVKVTDPDGKVEEVEMVKVEDKWVAKKMADEFNQNLDKVKEELKSSLAKIPEQQMAVGMAIGMVSGVVSTLESAKTAEDIEKAFAGLPINPMAMMGSIGTAKAKGTEAKEKSNLKQIGMSIAMHYADGTDKPLTGSFSQFEDMDKMDFDLNNYVMMAKKGDKYIGNATVGIACQKPDPSRAYTLVVFQDGHVEKVDGSHKSVEDVKKTLEAKGYKQQVD